LDCGKLRGYRGGRWNSGVVDRVGVRGTELHVPDMRISDCGK
jgi:hypothetical protein